MSDWFRTFDDSLWLKGDDTGAEDAAFIRRALRLRKGNAVLDAPCGAGRIGIHLARAGCRITGIDRKEAFVRRARARFRKEGLDGRFIVCDLGQIVFDGAFHGVFCWSGSFGYFGDKKNRDLMARYARALRPGGRLLIDQPNREGLLRNFYTVRTGSKVTIRPRWDARRQRVIATWTFRRGGRTVRSRSSIRLYTPAQMRRLMESAGLRVESVYGDADAGPYRRMAPRLITVGRNCP